MPLIEFSPETKEYGVVYDPPRPAVDFLPEWYKNSIRGIPDSPPITGGLPTQTVKACMPVFDIITAGYILPAQADLTFTLMDNECVDVSWRSGEQKFMSFHNVKQIGEYTPSPEFYPQPFKFEHNWIIKTPPGYSTMFFTPFWRDDLPFYVLPGLVDTDEHGTSINFPFLLRKDWTGTLYTGSPLVQFIPFKRDDWEFIVHEEPDTETQLKWKKASRTQKNAYKEHTRSIKNWK